MPEDLDEKLEGATQDFVARLESSLAERPRILAIRPSVVDVNNAQPSGLKAKGNEPYKIDGAPRTRYRSIG